MRTVTAIGPKAALEGCIADTRVEEWGMGLTRVDLLYQEWQWLVQEWASTLRAGRTNGLSDSELRTEEERYGLRIDAAYARLKQAEAQSVGMASKSF